MLCISLKMMANSSTWNHKKMPMNEQVIRTMFEKIYKAYSQTEYGSWKTRLYSDTISESKTHWHSVNKLFIIYPPGSGRMDLVIALPFQLFVLSLLLGNFNWHCGMFWDFLFHAATWGLISTDGVREVRGRGISQTRILPGWAESNSSLSVPFCSAQLCCTPAATTNSSKCFCS